MFKKKCRIGTSVERETSPDRSVCLLNKGSSMNIVIVLKKVKEKVLLTLKALWEVDQRASQGIKIHTQDT